MDSLNTSQWEAVERINAEVTVFEPHGRPGRAGRYFRVHGIDWDEDGVAHIVEDVIIDPFGYVVSREVGDGHKAARL